MEVPRTQFATTSDGVRIAYQDFGEGPPVVFCAEFLSNQVPAPPARRLTTGLAG